MKDLEQNKILYEGGHVRLRKWQGWEFAERCGINGIVGIVAVTQDGNLLLVEQFRPPVQSRVIELPAGLAGDSAGNEKETLMEAAKRELLEETGYKATRLEKLTAGPPSAGIITEIITFFRASGLKKVSPGGGDYGEDIIVHEVSIRSAPDWIREQEKSGILIDPKVFLGLYFSTSSH